MIGNNSIYRHVKSEKQDLCFDRNSAQIKKRDKLLCVGKFTNRKGMN